MEFTDYIAGRLSANGYSVKRETEYDLLVRTPEGQPAWICNLAFEITPEQIRRCFDFPGHVLFVVNEKLIPDTITDRDTTPMWLRVLHGLYMGRIYTWNGRVLYAMHFDYDTGDVNESSPIVPDELLLVENKTWLRGWPGTYRLARFFDQAFWTQSAKAQEEARRQHEERARQQQEQTRQQWQGWQKEWDSWNKYTYGSEDGPSSRRQYEQARDSYQEQARKQDYKNRQERGKGFGYQYEQFQKQAAGSARDFLSEFLKCGSLKDAKALRRKLALEYHPDLNPDKDTNEMMQAINNAWDKAERMLR